jgi:hypothetical protein
MLLHVVERAILQQDAQGGQMKSKIVMAWLVGIGLFDALIGEVLEEVPQEPL